ncbi:hypothetical protein KOR34_34110 [Posidoniimonas corsicana]|uniref:Uncharacterized protein n=1 Tax=Posidoniimonas corsicana TaxID=1938618 RepID=A0A5C5V6Q0_9BACT|nr:hypothetical protein [Posidoniimonas corsicana]TWT33579.1 hypothetical protein KOR34_34110 [Posidoniimonas corsicana]
MATLIVVLLLDLTVALLFGSGWRGGQFPFALNIISGFAVGQICLVGVWLAFRRRHGVVSWLAPPVILLCASWIRQQIGFFFEFTFLDYTCRNLLQGLFPLVVLWLLARTPAWRQVSRESDHAGLTLGYSIKHLLFWMTAVALMAGLIGRATQQNGSPLAVTQWVGVVAPGVIAILVVAIRQLPIPGALRCILHTAVGVAVGYAVAELAGNSLHRSLMVEFGVQAVVLALGIEVGRVTAATNSIEPEPAGQAADSSPVSSHDSPLG